MSFTKFSKTRYGNVWSATVGQADDENTEVVTVAPNRLIRFHATTAGFNDFFYSVEFGLSDGRTAGYYGRRESTQWVVDRPQCKIAYFSGYAGCRIDQLYVHWEC